MPLVRCPLPPDPGYEDMYNFYTSTTSEGCPAGRVRPEAMDIARSHTAGTIALLLSTPASHTMVKHSYTRPAKKNYSRANRRKIKELEYKRKQRQLGEVSRPATTSVKDRYSHVTAKVMSFNRPSTVPGHPAERLPSGEDSQLLSLLHPVGSSRAITSSTREDTLSQPAALNAAPLSATVGTQERKRKSTRNFMAINISKACQSHVRKAPAEKERDELKKKEEERQLNYKKGVVPHYLRARQTQWKREEEKRLAQIPDPSVPPGHVVMPTEERLRTLDILEQHCDELMKEFRSLPVTADTVRVLERKSKLEAKLREVDDAIKIFSRPRVFVKMDA